ncbi:MAG: PhnD/SsuA/transferrin family substrate-binding protein [Planctomycetota bacterium]
MTAMNRRTALTALATSPIALAQVLSAAEKSGIASELTMLVMDPLSKELSCPCVKGYAQREYNELGKHLSQRLKRPVKVVYSETLVGATKTGKLPDGVDLIIGKRSVVEFDAKVIQATVTPLAALSGKDGITTQYGMIVVPANDPAKKVADLKGYQIYFGPEDCDEKHKAAIALLKENGVAIPAKVETCSACSDGATKILELGADVRAATVISSYAAPLLEGCGTIQKGDLRVVGKTAPVPFVTAFATSRVGEKERAVIREILLELIESPKLCEALETQLGFVEIAAVDSKKK